MFDIVKKYTNQKNAEVALHASIKDALTEALPGFVPDRGKVIDIACNSAVTQFRIGIEWYKNNKPLIDN